MRGTAMSRALVLLAVCLAFLALTLVPPAHHDDATPRGRAAHVLGVARPAAAAPLADRVPPNLPGTQRRVVRWSMGGIRRELVDVAPARPEGALPLVVVLHGRRQTPWRAERTEQWDRLAARGQAFVAYGAGYAGSWNAGTCCGLAASAHLDDTAYLLRMLRIEEHRHPVDRRRVFLVGFSNGGMLALRFACQHPFAVSAVAVVDGSLETGCHPARAVSVLAISGDRDRVVPYGGSAYSWFAGAPTTSVPRSVRPWQLRDVGTSAVVQVVRLPRIGHDWPTERMGRWDATPHIWRFLLDHPQPTRST